MKTNFWFPILLVITISCSPTPTDEEAEKVMDLEKRRFQAMVDRDVDFLEQVIGEDLYYIHSNGQVDDKQAFIAPIAAGEKHYDDITIDNPQIRMYDKTAIINAECTYHRTDENGAPNNLSLLYTNVYAKINGNWQMVSWQSFKKE